MPCKLPEPALSCSGKAGRRGPMGCFLSVFLRLFVVCVPDRKDESLGICVVKDDTKISIEP